MKWISADYIRELMKNDRLMQGNAEYKLWEQEVDRRVDAMPGIIDPVRHGEWVATDDPWFSACSVCGYIEYECVGSNYCPECGSKMDGGIDDEID